MKTAIIGIITSMNTFRYRSGTIRFSVSYFTVDEDFEALKQALDYIEENI